MRHDKRLKNVTNGHTFHNKCIRMSYRSFQNIHDSWWLHDKKTTLFRNRGSFNENQNVKCGSLYLPCATCYCYSTTTMTTTTLFMGFVSSVGSYGSSRSVDTIINKLYSRSIPSIGKKHLEIAQSASQTRNGLNGWFTVKWKGSWWHIKLPFLFLYQHTN